MFVDARNLPTGQSLDAEICILGAGAAGISLALALRDQGKRVMLVESGGFEPEEATQALYEGLIEGDDYIALDNTRLRYLGGSTNHWAGNCRPYLQGWDGLSGALACFAWITGLCDRTIPALPRRSEPGPEGRAVRAPLGESDPRALHRPPPCIGAARVGEEAASPEVTAPPAKPGASAEM